MIGFLEFIAALLVLAIVHELGHYLTARLLGVRVSRVQVGTGHTLIDTTRFGTQWAVGWTLIGGYTRVYGMDKADKPIAIGDYRELHWLQKLLIVFGGIGANIVLAMVVFAAIAYLQGAALGMAIHAGAMAPLEALAFGARVWGEQLHLVDGHLSLEHFRFNGTVINWLYATAVLSVYAALLNLIPTKATDGGRAWRIVREEE